MPTAETLLLDVHWGSPRSLAKDFCCSHVVFLLLCSVLVTFLQAYSNVAFAGTWVPAVAAATFLLTVLFLYITATVNPGKAPEDAAFGTQRSFRSTHTQMSSHPKGACRCSLCNRFVELFDHHCYLSGACIGRRNRRFFLLFLLFSSSFTGWCAGWTVYRLVVFTFSPALVLDCYWCVACGVVIFTLVVTKLLNQILYILRCTTMCNAVYSTDLPAAIGTVGNSIWFVICPESVPANFKYEDPLASSYC